MPAIRLEEVNARNDPAISWRYLCYLPETIVNIPVLGGIAPLYIESVSLPHPSIEPVTRTVQASNKTYAGRLITDSIDITFYEDRDYIVYRFLDFWRDKVVDDDGNYGLPKDFKGNIRLETVDYEGISRYRFWFMGCWPIRVPNYEYNVDSSDRIRTSCTFSVDDIVSEPITTA